MWATSCSGTMQSHQLHLVQGTEEMWVPTVTSPYMSAVDWHVGKAWPSAGATSCEAHAGLCLLEG